MCLEMCERLKEKVSRFSKVGAAKKAELARIVALGDREGLDCWREYDRLERVESVLAIEIVIIVRAYLK